MMTLGYRPLVNVIILLTMIVIVHNAPIKSKRESGVYLRAKTQQFYCISEVLKHQVKAMVEERNAVVTPMKHSSSSEHQILSLTIQQFNFTCAALTTVMAIKYQLQKSVFSGQFFIKENDELVRVNNKEDIKNLMSTLEHLQTLTTILQDIARILSTKDCIVFSPSEYRRLYCDILDKDKCTDGASVLKTLQSVSWTKVPDYPSEWKNPAPQHCMCNGSCFT